MIKRIVMGLLLIGILAPLHAEELKPYLKPKVFTGPSGEKMVMVFLQPPEKHQVLIRFENFADSVWNDKVILHVKKGSSDHQIYQSKEMERPTVDVKTYEGMVVRPRGSKADVQMGEWSGNIDEVHPYELINAYLAQQKTVEKK